MLFIKGYFYINFVLKNYLLKCNCMWMWIFVWFYGFFEEKKIIIEDKFDKN